MVQRTTHPDAWCRFVIRPNRSMTWRQVQLFVFGVSAVCLGVAGFWAAQGFWPILPFAGIEVLALGFCSYLVAKSGRKTEVVVVDDERVSIEKGERRPSQRWEFDRAWARVCLHEGAHHWYPSRLVIRSHGREVGLGDFLAEEERRHLAGELSAAIAGR